MVQLETSAAPTALFLFQYEVDWRPWVNERMDHKPAFSREAKTTVGWISRNSFTVF
jgi:hypothetical protein